MTREEMIKIIESVKTPVKEKNKLYRVADELGITYKKNNCPKCAKDLWNIIREELGLIKDAAEESDFNNTDYEYIYLGRKSQAWNGHLINQDTDPAIIAEFIKRFPKYYKVVEKTKLEVNEQTEPQHEENINNED